MRRALVRGALVIVLLVVVAGCSDDDDDGSTTTSTAARAPDLCAWNVRADKDTLNIAYPDTAATYWAISYRLAEGERLELSGRFPAARYASFTTYGLFGGVVDVLADRDIDPDDGTNPFRPGGRPADAADGGGGSYTISIEGDPARRDEPNVLSAVADEGGGGGETSTSSVSIPEQEDRVLLGSGGDEDVTGTVLYRVYLAVDPADPTGGAGLPEVRVVGPSGDVEAVPTCETPGPSQAAIDIVNSIERPATGEPPATPIFIRPEPRALNLFPNPDNVYVATTLAHRPGKVVVIRGRAPTFPDTGQGAAITGDEQVRFWSLCTNELRKPYPVTDCAADEAVELDRTGWYTFVISTPEDRPREMTGAEGSTWLDWGATDVPALLLLRHMLADPSFTQAANRVEPGALAAGTMGEYAPQGAYCDKAVFEEGGFPACGL